MSSMVRLAWIAAIAILLGWLSTLDATALLLHKVAQSGPGVPLVAALGLMLSHACRAMRLYGEWSQRRGVAYLECLRVGLLHTAAVNLAPMRSGELGYPVLLNRRWGVPMLEAATSLLWLRVQDAVVLAWLLALTACAALTGLPLSASGWLGVAGACLATAAFLRLVSLGRGESPPAAAGPGQPMGRRLLGLPLAALRRATPASWLSSVLNWLLKLGALGLLFATWSESSLQAAWRAALGGELAAALPVQAPAGFGSLEAGMALGALSTGTGDTAELLAAALGVHLFALAVTFTAAAWAAAPFVSTRPACRQERTG